MVRLRGLPRAGPPGRGMGRPMPRHMRPEPPLLPPFGMPRGRLLRGHPVRPGPPRLPPPRMAPPPLPGLGLPPPLPPRRLPLPHHPPIPPRDLPLPLPMGRRPLPPPPLPRRPGLRMPPLPMPPVPPNLRRPMRPGPPFVRGRGGVAKRGVKRLGTNTNGRAKKSQKRKEKTEGEFFCEACDRGFKSQELLDAHITEHEVCGRDGCKFEAHPKIVEKHVQLQHETGLYHRIVFTQNPEDVAKWIAERKSRYPTKENMEKKEAQYSEMIQRGERIPMQGKPFQKREKREDWQDRKRRRNQNTINKDGNLKRKINQNHNVINDITKLKDPDAWRGELPKFPGTATFSLVIDEPVIETQEGKNFSDDEPDINRDQVVQNKPSVSNVLASLIMNYGSDTEDDNNDDIFQSKKTMVLTSEVPSSITNEPLVTADETDAQNSLLEVSKHDKEEDSDSGPEEIGIQKEDTSSQPVTKPDKDDKTYEDKKIVKSKMPETSQSLRPKPSVRPTMKRYQLSLLEKLLQNEIRHERNAILQCVRFVVNNNFFGCGSKN